MAQFVYCIGVQTTTRGPTVAYHLVIIGSHQSSENVVVYHIYLYILSILYKLNECPIMISPKYSINAAIEGNVIDVICST